MDAAALLSAWEVLAWDVRRLPSTATIEGLPLTVAQLRAAVPYAAVIAVPWGPSGLHLHDVPVWLESIDEPLRLSDALRAVSTHLRRQRLLPHELRAVAALESKSNARWAAALEATVSVGCRALTPLDLLGDKTRWGGVQRATDAPFRLILKLI